MQGYTALQQPLEDVITAHTGKTSISSLFFAALSVVLLPLALGCAPDRSGDDDDSGPPSNSLSHALFTVIDNGPGQTFWQGRLVLVDSNTDCSELNWGGALAWWELAEEVEFIELYLTLGVDVASWTQEFESFYLWQEDGIFDYRTASFFTGQIGTGSTADGDDDDDVPDPPPPIGREVTGQFGNDEETRDDSLSINSYSPDGPVSGVLQSSVGNYIFSATHCGVVSEVPIGEEPVGGETPTPG